MYTSWSCNGTVNLSARLLGVVLCFVATAGHAAPSNSDPTGMALVSADLLTMSVSNLGKLIQAEEVCDESDVLAQPSGNRSAPLLALNAQANAGNRAKNAATPAATVPKPAATGAPAKTSQTPPAEASPSTPLAAQTPVQPSWEMSLTDKTLNAALARWAAQAGWQLVWDIPVDYAVEARTSVPGTFVEAVTLVTKSMATAEIPMKAIFYDGNKVLRIVSKGAE